MPNVKIVNLGKTIRVGHNANLRQALLHNKVTPYKGVAKFLNCHGFGTCGTCAVKLISGEVSAPSFLESLRGHGKATRLSCQTRVLGDLEIETMTGETGAKNGATAKGAGQADGATGTTAAAPAKAAEGEDDAQGG